MKRDKIYESPLIEVTETVVEQGFAVSPDSAAGGSGGGFGEGWGSGGDI